MAIPTSTGDGFDTLDIFDVAPAEIPRPLSEPTD